MSVSTYIGSIAASAQASLDPFGVIGLILAIVSTQLRDRQHMLLCAVAGTACWAAHYARLGSYTGSIACMFAVVQGVVAARFVRPDDRPDWVVVLFALILGTVFALSALTWNGYASFFACCGSALATLARLQRSFTAMRALFLCMTVCWWAHDVAMQTPLALACETLAIIGFIVAILRDALSPTKVQPC